MTGPAPDTPLPGLPGASADPGEGPATLTLLESLLEPQSSGQVPVWPSTSRDLIGPVRVPAGAAEPFLAALPTGEHARPIVLVADGSLDDLRATRNLLLDDDRVELTGVHVALPPGTAPGPGTRALLDALDFSVPAWVSVPLVPGWQEALEVLAKDGAESVALDPAGPGGAALPDDLVAAFIRLAVDRDLSLSLATRPWHAVREPGASSLPGVLNLLGSVRAALNGAEAPEVAEVLAGRDAAPLASGTRRMSDADAAVVRVFVTGFGVPEAGVLLDELDGLGLLP
jgi:hypothetical protein